MDPTSFTAEVILMQRFYCSSGGDVRQRALQSWREVHQQIAHRPRPRRQLPAGPILLLPGGEGQALGLRLYRASDRLKGAATYTHGGKGSGNCSLGLFHELMKGTTVKTKVAQDQSFSFAVKHEVSKGFTWIGGGKYDSKKGDYTCGL
ncbi:unnamed protein product [Prorocentrum cordatum]|uniref:Uncharacterized protein n=1 Tax=Prorocentrum cordatum TaxID=2364126 RepID=A0ABN9SHD7_9DINO|nr:unnamed protein product [Polarella glacialis]